jgi:outer membrane putative beta-barrel porin/alpha-amylase
VKIIERAVCFAAGLVLLTVLAATSAFAQTSGVPLDFGANPGDLLFAYGFQYQATPRHSGATSDAYLLPGTVSYNLAPKWTVRVDATTLKSVDYSGQPRATGFGDMDTDISFAALKESLTAPGLTLDYQLNLPTGDSTEKLGTGQFGHRFTAGVVKGRNSWSYQLSAGDLLARKKSGYDHSNAIFTSVAATYTFPKKDLSNAVPTFKNEIDFIPAYSSDPQIVSSSTPKITVPTEIYFVSTLSLPLRWNTKLTLVGRAGITPYTPKFVVMMQFQHMIRPIPCVGCP